MTKSLGRRPRVEDSQPARLLKLLQEGPQTALAIWSLLGIYRAADAVHVLRKRGYNIETRMIDFTTTRGYEVTFAEYRIGE